MNTNYLYSVIVLLIVAAVVRYVARNAKKWVTPSGTTLEEQLKKRDERMAQAQSASRHPLSPDMPDAACVVCDNTGEDHFAHDKAQRIAQLDAFLKNGIIDKAEYQVLLKRYKNSGQ